VHVGLRCRCRRYALSGTYTLRGMGGSGLRVVLITDQGQLRFTEHEHALQLGASFDFDSIRLYWRTNGSRRRTVRYRRLRRRARYRDSSGKEHLHRFALKRDAQRWLDQETSKWQTGSWVAPRDARITVAQWCQTWLRAYGTRKPSTVRQAQVHIDKIVEAFGPRRLDSLRPSEIRSWLVELTGGLCRQLHLRLARPPRSDPVRRGP
jgi:hypothetical protein